MEQNNLSISNSSHKIFNLLFISISFLLPILVFPSAYTFSSGFKLIVLSTITAISVIAILLNILHSGIIEFPKTKLIGFLFAIPLIFLVSSFFSKGFSASFFGTAFEVGTSGSMIMLGVLFFVSIVFGLRRYVIIKSMIAFLASMAVCILHLIIVSLMAHGALPVISNFPLYLVGSYYDLAILLCAGILLSLCILNLSNVDNRLKYILWTFNILSILIIGVVGFRSVQIVLGIFTLSLFVYFVSVSRNYSDSWIKKSYSSVFVLLASLVLIISGTSLSVFLANIFKINSIDVRPSMEATFQIAKEQFKNNPVTGAGANHFAELWSLYRPVEVNLSDFWNTDFVFGYGFVPTMFATTGILGVVAIILFLFFFIKKGLKVLFSGEYNERNVIAISVFVTTLFLWVSLFFYNPSIVALLFVFMWTGFFIATLSDMGAVSNFRVNIFSNPKTNFISVFVVVALMLSVVSLEYFIWKKMVASAIFNRAVVAYSVHGDVNKAGTDILRAAKIYDASNYQRSLASLELVNIERVMASIPERTSQISDSVRDQLQFHIGNAIGFANGAITKDPFYYQNYIVIGNIYESLAVRNIEGAAESARKSYLDALKLNPKNPAIQLALARTELFLGNIDKARELINKSIEFKPNYTDAYYLLAQLEAANNNLPGTIKAVENTTLINPENPGLYFQLGLLKYQSNDITGAITAFERAILLVPDYANAKYFLGLSYNAVGRNDVAVEIFRDLVATNPDNAEVKLILSNLEAGKAPFVGAEPPIDNKPESRREPPIEENR